jgi:hypothetical protein
VVTAVTEAVRGSVSVPVTVATILVVVSVETVTEAGIVTVVVAAARPVIRQLQAELMRVAGTVASTEDRFAGVVASRFFTGAA